MAWNTLSDHLPSLVRTLRSLRAALMLSPTSCVRHSENHSPYPYSSFSFLVEVLNFFQASLRNCINCVHCDDHFFIFISFPQFIYDLFHISLTLISFTGTKEPTIDLLPTSVAKIAQLVEHRTGIGFKPRWSSEFFSGFITQLHKLRSLRRSFLHFQRNVW